MIVFRDYRESVSPRASIERMLQILGNIRQHTLVTHDDAVELLVESGELESGVADSICAVNERWNSKLEAVRNLTCQSASIVCTTWRKEQPEPNVLESLTTQLTEFAAWKDLPQRMPLSVPEGFAFYGLFPESYVEAADVFFAEKKPERVVVVGLRSIGTSLSAVVCARLREHGCNAKSYTLRPRGHPFDRHPILDSEFVGELKKNNGAWFAVCDEGPGLSGSSFGGTTACLTECGIPADRIVLFPSWTPDASGLCSEKARYEWSRYQKFSVDFEYAWINTGRLQDSFESLDLHDMSAGTWRKEYYFDECAFPGTHPHHERRKYVANVKNNRGNERSLFKFVGLGRYGRFLQNRAEKIGKAGFGPSAANLKNGFVEMQFIDGKPLSAGSANIAFLNRAADYLIFLAKNFPGSLTASYEKMIEMIRENVREGLGIEWVDRLGFVADISAADYESRIVAVDGRMLPHDWLEYQGTWIKTDHLEHHTDQFFPGCQNICWDIAGLIMEFELNGELEKYFVNAFIENEGDRNISRRLLFYKIAYLAYRLGYADLASGSLRKDPDAKRLAIMADNYRLQLKGMLELYAG